MLASSSLDGLKQSSHACFSRFSSAFFQFGMTHCEPDLSVFFIHFPFGHCIYLVVYIDDIVIARNDSKAILCLKSHLHSQFQTTKDMGPLKYF